MLAGSINHISVTVTDLAEAVTMLGPFLERLGYEIPADLSRQPVVCLSRRTGGAFNLWQTKPALRDRRVELYAPGLHHIAFNAESRDQVDSLHAVVRRSGMEILDPPAEWPFTAVGTYYAFYFRGPDGMKFECVHMSALEALYREAGLLDKVLWTHEEA